MHASTDIILTGQGQRKAKLLRGKGFTFRVSMECIQKRVRRIITAATWMIVS